MSAMKRPYALFFTRDDNGKSVKVTYHPGECPADQDMHELFTKSIVGTANEKQKDNFKEM